MATQICIDIDISDEPKCGVRDHNGTVIGFVHASFHSKLKTLRNLIHSQVSILSIWNDNSSKILYIIITLDSFTETWCVSIIWIFYALHFLFQILQGSNFSEAFQFTDENSWPISIIQEGHMTLLDILIGHCVSTTIQRHLRSPPFTPSRGPPLKKLKL